MQYYTSWNEIYDARVNADVVICGDSRAKLTYSPKILDSVLGTNSNWSVLQDLLGADGTNYTVTTVATDLLPAQFLAFGVSEDSDGDSTISNS